MGLFGRNDKEPSAHVAQMAAMDPVTLAALVLPALASIDESRHGHKGSDPHDIVTAVCGGAASTEDRLALEHPVHEALQVLEHNRLVRLGFRSVSGRNDEWIVTRAGHAALGAGELTGRIR